MAHLSDLCIFCCGKWRFLKSSEFLRADTLRHKETHSRKSRFATRCLLERRKEDIIATKSPPEIKHNETWKNSKILKLMEKWNASLSGSNYVDLCCRKINISNKYIPKLENVILQKMVYNDVDHGKNVAEWKHTLSVRRKKLYEYPGGKQVDGLPQVLSFEICSIIRFR